MPRHLVTPIRCVSESPRCQHSNGASHILLASVPAELQAIIKMVFIGEFLLNLKADISMPRHSLTPVRCVSESPRCQLSNNASHNLLASGPMELQAAIEMVFTGEFLQTLKADISTPSHSLTPADISSLSQSLAPPRHVPESPRCQLSNGTSHVLLASVPAEL
ncbi:hypothetical protein L873DRAFT_1792688 [Choiromyces venosus 120613-1]|uniref:Uncharacterized protein n=1 Tax=Choiromyces venosus 120613-1 TaxID=1336337 RepID=A0A3N4JBS8_9PEZI|nr:hypothetical protein L873DRAFT_1792688 [Choiromyces venosus 120613-1]